MDVAMPVTIGFLRFEVNAQIPTKATEGSSGWDLYSTENLVLNSGDTALVDTGIGIQLPAGYEAQIRPRSSLSMRGLLVAFGTIDEDYRGRLKVCVTAIGRSVYAYQIRPGDRIAQLVIAPVQPAGFYELSELDATQRGAGGFGSSGR